MGPRPDDAGAVGAALAALLECFRCCVVTLDYDDDLPLYAVQAVASDGEPRHALGVGDSLLGALEAAAGIRQEMVCKRCGKPGPVSAFARHVDYPLGRKPICRACERARMRQVNANRRRRQATAGASS